MTLNPPGPGILPPADFLLPVRKSAGISSRRSLDLVARTLHRRDLGHAGTLDPFAEGLLLVLGGRATRLVPWIQQWDKEYVGRIRLGVGTDSLDATGAIVAAGDVPDFSGEDLAAAARSLTGRVMQAPPMYSAVHSGGGRLYELARQGVEVERTPRARDVGAFDLLTVALPDVTVRVTCSSGTYVRVLAESFGRTLGVPAHLAALNRTRIGPWTLDQAVGDQAAAGLPPEGLAPLFIPLAEILADWPETVPPDEVSQSVRNGRLPVEWAAHALPAGRSVRLRMPDGRLLALACRTAAGGARLLRVFDSASGGSPAAVGRGQRTRRS